MPTFIKMTDIHLHLSVFFFPLPPSLCLFFLFFSGQSEKGGNVSAGSLAGQNGGHSSVTPDGIALLIWGQRQRGGPPGLDQEQVLRGGLHGRGRRAGSFLKKTLTFQGHRESYGSYSHHPQGILIFYSHTVHTVVDGSGIVELHAIGNVSGSKGARWIRGGG